MAVYGPYDQATFAQYTPLSSQEILQPAMMMRDRHDKLDAEYAAIDDELQKASFIVQHENDSAIKSQYQNYMNSLSQGRDALMNRGVTANSNRQMLGLRSRFQSEIQPINLGYQMKLQDIQRYNDMIAKDPTYIGQDPSSRTVSDYINNGLQPFTQQGISGTLVTKMAAEYLHPFSQESLTEPQVKELLKTTVGEEQIPQFLEIIRQYGYKPGTEGHKMLMQAARNKVIESTGVKEWATTDDLARIHSHIDLAESSTIGKLDSSIRDNNRYVIAAQKQAAKEASQDTPIQFDVTNLGVEHKDKDTTFQEEIANMQFDSSRGIFVNPKSIEQEGKALAKQQELDADYAAKTADPNSFLNKFNSNIARLSDEVLEENKRKGIGVISKAPINEWGREEIKAYLKLPMGATNQYGVSGTVAKYLRKKLGVFNYYSKTDEAVEEANKYWKDYGHLDSDPTKALQKASQLQTMQSSTINNQMTFGFDSNILDNIKSNIWGTVSNVYSSNSGNSKLGLKEVGKSKAASYKEASELFTDNKNLSISVSPKEGIIFTDGSVKGEGKKYTVSGSSTLDGLNATIKDSFKYLSDFTSKDYNNHEKIAINNNEVSYLNDGDTRNALVAKYGKNGKLIVQSEDGNMYKLMTVSNNGSPLTLVSSLYDELQGASTKSQMLQHWLNNSIKGLANTFMGMNRTELRKDK